MNIPLSEKYDKIISLGCNCFIKFFLKHIEYEQETHFFDYIGCPMWSVHELIKNNFSDVFNIEEYKNEYTLIGLPKIVTNSRYNLKFKHDSVVLIMIILILLIFLKAILYFISLINYKHPLISNEHFEKFRNRLL